MLWLLAYLSTLIPSSIIWPKLLLPNPKVLVVGVQLLPRPVVLQIREKEVSV